MQANKREFSVTPCRGSGYEGSPSIMICVNGTKVTVLDDKELKEVWDAIDTVIGFTNRRVSPFEASK